MNHLRKWYYKIEEPRLVRLLYLAFYLIIVWTGVNGFLERSDELYALGGYALIGSLGGFFFFGGVCGVIAILPGTWWLERVGLVSIGFGLAGRAIVITALGVTPVGATLFVSEIILLIARFVLIRKADLAPISE